MGDRFVNNLAIRTRLSSCVGDFGAVLMVAEWWLGRHVPPAAPFGAASPMGSPLTAKE